MSGASPVRYFGRVFYSIDIKNPKNTLRTALKVLQIKKSFQGFSASLSKKLIKTRRDYSKFKIFLII